VCMCMCVYVYVCVCVCMCHLPGARQGGWVAAGNTGNCYHLRKVRSDCDSDIHTFEVSNLFYSEGES